MSCCRTGVLLFLIASGASGQCSWSVPPGMNSMGAGSMLTFDEDGPGPNPPALFVGGFFTTAAGGPNNFARWDGTSWTAVGGASPNAEVLGMTSYDEDGPGGQPPVLIVCGGFTSIGGVAIGGVARWDGTSWSPLGSGIANAFQNPGRGVAVFDEDGPGGALPSLFLAGGFTSVGGIPANGIARWNGSTWSPVGAGVSGGTSSQGDALEVFDDGTGPALYLSGLFTAIGSLSVNHIARWDGQSWSALGQGLMPAFGGFPGRDLIVHDDGSGPALFASGVFAAAGGVTVNGVARWDGASWSALGSPPGASVNAIVSGLGVFDDGNGPDLYATGSLTSAGASSASGIARWDGGAWSTLQSGLTGTSLPRGAALEVFDDGSGPALFVYGEFVTAGGIPAAGFARWGCSGTFPSVSVTQPGGPGGLVYVSNQNLRPSARHFNVFSVEACPGAPGSGPLLGLCASPGPAFQFLVDQVNQPLGTLSHFCPAQTHVTWPPLAVPPVVVEGLCLEVPGATISAMSPVLRFTVQ